MARLPRAVWLILTLTVTCSTRRLELARLKERVMPVVLLLGMATLSPDWVETTLAWDARFAQDWDRLTAAVALMSPAPKL